MARFLALFLLSFSLFAQDYYEEAPMSDDYDAYDQPQELMKKTKDINPMPQDSYYEDPPENFDAPPAPVQDVEPYPADEPYPEDPYPVSDGADYQENY